MKKSFKQKSTHEQKYLKVATTIEESEDELSDEDKSSMQPPSPHGKDARSDEVFVTAKTDPNKVHCLTFTISVLCRFWFNIGVFEITLSQTKS